MALKERQERIELAAAGWFESGGNLSGVMTIVMDHGEVVDDALDVKAEAHSGKLDEAFANQVRWNVQIQRDGRCGCGVADIVHAGRVREPEQAEIFALVSQPEFAAETFEFHVADHQIGLARRSISDDRSLHAGNDGLHVRLVDTKNCRAVKWHAI